ncbi:MAG: hypothetical protein LBK62_02995 [Treponema sp.]|nr:hypothetical protein [Treponema sp.]
MANIDYLFRKGQPERPLNEPVYMADTTGRVMRITCEQALGDGVYWFVAEETPSYGAVENKEVHHG